MKPVKNNKTAKVKSFFFFLLIAILFWGLTKLSRQYTASVDSSILYTNIPPQMMLDDGNAESISFDITANGFEFLTYKLKVPILNIDVESFYDEETNKAVISKANVIQLVSKQLEKGVAIKNVSVNELIVKFAEQPRQIHRRGNVYNGEVCGANTRLPFGHPEAFIEAFANVYLGVADAIADEVEGNYPRAESYDFPTIEDGVEGMAFIEAAVRSSQNNAAWTKLES